MTTQAELADALDALTQTVTKIGLETSATLDKVAELEAAISAGGTVSAEVQTALDALRAQIKTVDDLVPDSTP